MLQLSGSDETDEIEMPTFHYVSDPFNTLPDELVLKIIKMVLNNFVDDHIVTNLRDNEPRFNFIMKVVRKISPRYVTIIFLSLNKGVKFFHYCVGSSSSPLTRHFGEVM